MSKLTITKTKTTRAVTNPLHPKHDERPSQIAKLYSDHLLGNYPKKAVLPWKSDGHSPLQFSRYTISGKLVARVTPWISVGTWADSPHTTDGGIGASLEIPCKDGGVHSVVEIFHLGSDEQGAAFSEWLDRLQGLTPEHSYGVGKGKDGMGRGRPTMEHLTDAPTLMAKPFDHLSSCKQALAYEECGLGLKDMPCNIANTTHFKFGSYLSMGKLKPHPPKLSCMRAIARVMDEIIALESHPARDNCIDISWEDWKQKTSAHHRKGADGKDYAIRGSMGHYETGTDIIFPYFGFSK
jgi:hypothetical protein